MTQCYVLFIFILKKSLLALVGGAFSYKTAICCLCRYKIFGKALERIQHDNQVGDQLWKALERIQLNIFFSFTVVYGWPCQVTVRIGSPVTGYGSESRNRAARQRIPNRVWTDEHGVEHVEVKPSKLFRVFVSS